MGEALLNQAVADAGSARVLGAPEVLAALRTNLYSIVLRLETVVSDRDRLAMELAASKFLILSLEQQLCDLRRVLEAQSCAVERAERNEAKLAGLKSDFDQLTDAFKDLTTARRAPPHEGESAATSLLAKTV